MPKRKQHKITPPAFLPSIELTERIIACQVSQRGPISGDHMKPLPWISTPSGPILALSDHLRHLVAWPYNTANLHAMAEALGIGRHFYSTRPHGHYDIPARRIEEIESRTVRVRPREIIKIIRGGHPPWERMI
jgi:hypothetical protein